MPQQRWTSDASRLAWQAMSSQQRRQIVRAARKGQAPEDPGTTTLALHWAWAVIGPPTARRKYPWLAVFEVRPNAAFADIYDGTSRNDARTYVRRDARKVEKVCLRHLQELGLDTGPAE